MPPKFVVIIAIYMVIAVPTVSLSALIVLLITPKKSLPVLLLHFFMALAAINLALTFYIFIFLRQASEQAAITDVFWIILIIISPLVLLAAIRQNRRKPQALVEASGKGA